MASGVHDTFQRVRKMGRVFAFTPTSRFALSIAVIAPLWLLSVSRVGYVIAAVASVALFAALVVDVAGLPTQDHIELIRTFPETIGIGDTESGELAVRSEWHRPLRVDLFQALPAKFLSVAGTLPPIALTAHQSQRREFTARGLYRGQVSLGDLAARITTKLGLAARTFRYAPRDKVLVAPSLSGVKRFRWLAMHHRLATAGVRNTRRMGEGSSFARLRDYVVGDDPRYIDWKATARRGRPITREFTVEQSQTVFVLVDAGRTMTQISGALPRFEYALSATLLLADVAIATGDRVGAMVFDDELRALVPAQKGLAALQAIRSALIPVQPTLVEPDYATAFNTLAKRQRKRALIVLITDVVDARVAKSLLAHVSRGVSRHLAVVVALKNQSLIQAAAEIGERSSDLYTNAAAEELLGERAASLQRMRDAGIVVLDVAADAMAAAVVNQYLELKARSAL